MAKRKEFRQDRKLAIAIAKDCLAQLRQQKLHLIHRRYFLPIELCPRTGSMQQQIDRVQATCRVCAAGGLFLSYVRLRNQVDCADRNAFGCFGGIAGYLVKAFSRLELALIEAVFEGAVIQNCMFKQSDLSLTEIERTAVTDVAVDWLGQQLSKLHLREATWSRRDRTLAAICRQIIRGKGYFNVPGYAAVAKAYELLPPPKARPRKATA